MPGEVAKSSGIPLFAFSMLLMSVNGASCIDITLMQPAGADTPNACESCLQVGACVDA